MLNIGQVLKEERLAQNKTQREWIKNIHLSVSRYSEIENGIIKNGKKADIDSEQLILLLKNNNVDIMEFFSKLQDDVSLTDELSLELSQSFNSGDIKKANEIKNKILTDPEVSLGLKYRAILVTAELKDHMASLDQNTIDEISNYLYKSNDWVKNKEALILFGNSMPRMNQSILQRRMKQIIKEYADISRFPDSVQRRISTICINYVFNAIFVYKMDTYVRKSLDLIESLPANDVYGLKKLVGQYYADYLKGDQKHMTELKDLLARCGYTSLANRLSFDISK
ncbi:helix-turn-helix domain-containing protein [Lactobacillus ultunensis]|uniref:helix-turn-helix domain-containing protein n=1 Tax=Lactobacillus ultunensis TaxID=227945 RepID=UPI0019148C33|nr:transcriptional regulator [Lactobacillus ultunensis]QQP28530.1 transcriptional regulator [Lactobacillus ultunensis]